MYILSIVAPQTCQVCGLYYYHSWYYNISLQYYDNTAAKLLHAPENCDLRSRHIIFVQFIQYTVGTYKYYSILHYCVGHRFLYIKT